MRVLIVFIMSFIIGCASGASGLLRFQDRELLIHPDKPGLGYPHKVEVCKDRKKPFRWLGKKCETKFVIDFYDLNDVSVRKKLIDATFSCKSKARFKY